MNETIIYDIINSNGGIPLIVETVNKTNWPQFSISIIISLIGFIFIFLFLWDSISLFISSKKTRCSLKKIAKSRKKNVMLIKHTESGFFNQSMIDYKSLKEMQKAILEFEGKPFDLILHTPGGSIFYTLLISKMLKKYKGKISAFIPSYSMSGGTVLALSCDDIYMNDISCIGPIDPQLGTLFKVGSAKAWKEILKIKGKKAEDSSIAMNLTGEQYTKTIAKILSDLIDGKIKNKKEFIKFLTSGDVEHGYQIFKDDLIKFGLDIKSIDNDLNDNLLKVISSEKYEGIEYVKFKKGNKFKRFIKKIFRK
jgi:ClpP class serine protease